MPGVSCKCSGQPRSWSRASPTSASPPGTPRHVHHTTPPSCLLVQHVYIYIYINVCCACAVCCVSCCVWLGRRSYRGGGANTQELLGRLDGLLLLRRSSEPVRAAALGCVGAVLGAIDDATAARELVPFLASPEASPQHERQCDEPPPEGRGVGAVGAGLVGGTVVEIALRGSLLERAAALDVLGRLGRVFPLARHLWPHPLLPVFVAALRSPDSSVRYHALSALAALTRPPKAPTASPPPHYTPPMLPPAPVALMLTTVSLCGRCWSCRAHVCWPLQEAAKSDHHHHHHASEYQEQQGEQGEEEEGNARVWREVLPASPLHALFADSNPSIRGAVASWLANMSPRAFASLPVRASPLPPLPLPPPPPVPARSTGPAHAER
jgi:hypothetical protein